MAGLPAEKIVELKQIIHNHLSQMDVHRKIKDVLEESMQEQDDEVGEEDLLNALREKGVVDDVMKSLRFIGLEKSKPHRQAAKEKKSSGIPLAEVPTGQLNCHER